MSARERQWSRSRRFCSRLRLVIRRRSWRRRKFWRNSIILFYGDGDVSVLDEMPRGRGKVVTAVRDSSKLGEVLTFFRKQLEAGRQLYVVYPLIEESEKLEAKAAAAEYERWHERLHPYSCELLHGRIPGP